MAATHPNLAVMHATNKEPVEIYTPGTKHH